MRNLNKIVVLHETFLREEHLEQLRAVAKVQVFLQTKSLEQAVSRLAGANIAVVDSFELSLDKEFFARCAHLDLVVINSTGYDKVDLSAAQKFGVLVANTPDFSTNSVAELNLALIFSLVRKLPVLDKKFRKNPQKPDCDPFDSAMLPFFGGEIAGKTLGTIGFGNIGKALAKKADALGMKVLVYSRNLETADFARAVGLQELLRESDFVAINTPLTPKTRDLLGKNELAMMKKSAFLINTARAGIVNLQALTAALAAKQIAGAGLEVVEPLPEKHPLLQMENVIFGLHSGSLTQEASWQNLPNIIVQTVLAFAAGEELNILERV